VKQVSEPNDVAAELVRLREENARLRALLGMDERPADGHSVVWSLLV
jgi:cell shape-determining protein MreC